MTFVVALICVACLVFSFSVSLIVFVRETRNYLDEKRSPFDVWGS